MLKNFVSQLSTLVEKLTAILQPKKYSKPEKPNGGHGFFLYNSPLKIASPPPSKDPDLELAVEGRNELRHLSRPAPSFHDDPDDAGLFGDLEASTIPQSPPFVITAAKLRQAGYRSYLTRSGNFFTDEALVDDAETKKFLSSSLSD